MGTVVFSKRQQVCLCLSSKLLFSVSVLPAEPSYQKSFQTHLSKIILFGYTQDLNSGLLGEGAENDATDGKQRLCEMQKREN